MEFTVGLWGRASARTSMPDGIPSPFVAPLVEALRRQPTSIAIAGLDRARLTRVGLGLTERLDADGIWFDIRMRHAEPPSWQQSLLGRFPGRRHQTIFVDEMKLDRGGQAPVESVLDPEDPLDRESLSLTELMRIPASLREVALDPRPDGHPRAIVLTNAERASAAFEGTQGALRPYIEALNRFRLTVVVTTMSRPRENVHDFDLDLVVEGTGDRGGAPPELRCVAVRTPGLFPAIPPGTRYLAEGIERSTNTRVEPGD
jgi:hypothetical protein